MIQCNLCDKQADVFINNRRAPPGAMTSLWFCEACADRVRDELSASLAVREGGT